MEAKAAKKAADAGVAHVPVQARPEATFLPTLLDGFFEALDGALPPVHIKAAIAVLRF